MIKPNETLGLISSHCCVAVYTSEKNFSLLQQTMIWRESNHRRTEDGAAFFCQQKKKKGHWLNHFFMSLVAYFLLTSLPPPMLRGAWAAEWAERRTHVMNHHPMKATASKSAPLVNQVPMATPLGYAYRFCLMRKHNPGIPFLGRIGASYFSSKGGKEGTYLQGRSTCHQAHLR